MKNARLKIPLLNKNHPIDNMLGRSQALEDELMLLRLLDHHNKRTGTTRDTPGMYMPENDATAGNSRNQGFFLVHPSSASSRAIL